jgi:hypothetical protein
MFDCHLRSVVALRAFFSYRYRAEGVSENDKRQLNIEMDEQFLYTFLAGLMGILSASRKYLLH